MGGMMMPCPYSRIEFDDSEELECLVDSKTFLIIDNWFTREVSQHLLIKPEDAYVRVDNRSLARAYP